MSVGHVHKERKTELIENGGCICMCGKRGHLKHSKPQNNS